MGTSTCILSLISNTKISIEKFVITHYFYFASSLEAFLAFVLVKCLINTKINNKCLKHLVFVILNAISALQDLICVVNCLMDLSNVEPQLKNCTLIPVPEIEKLRIGVLLDYCYKWYWHWHLGFGDWIFNPTRRGLVNGHREGGGF